jgi:DNA-binding winged helix-turn-helix (wHTH) protein
MARVWPGVVVEENNIHVYISALRKVLEQGKSDQSCLASAEAIG